MTGKILACVTAVAGAAVLTLATVIALVLVSIRAVSIADLPLRALAVCADIVLGSLVLLGCIYLATHLAVRILGVGNIEFPPLPESLGGDKAPLNDPHSALPPKI
jgi:hypothetical protein